MSASKKLKSIEQINDVLRELYPQNLFCPDKVLENLSSILSKELKKRGFFAPITLEWNSSCYNFCFGLNSDEFNTTPALFLSVKIQNFGGTIDIVDEERVEFWLPVHASWKHFDTGQNSTAIFYVEGNILPDMVKITKIY